MEDKLQKINITSNQLTVQNLLLNTLIFFLLFYQYCFFELKYSLTSNLHVHHMQLVYLRSLSHFLTLPMLLTLCTVLATQEVNCSFTFPILPAANDNYKSTIIILIC